MLTIMLFHFWKFNFCGWRPLTYTFRTFVHMGKWIIYVVHLCGLNNENYSTIKLFQSIVYSLYKTDYEGGSHWGLVWSPTCCRYSAYMYMYVYLLTCGCYWCDDLSLCFRIKHPTLPIWTQCSSLHTLKRLINLVFHFEEIKEILYAIVFLFCDSGWREKNFQKVSWG